MKYKFVLFVLVVFFSLRTYSQSVDYLSNLEDGDTLRIVLNLGDEFVEYSEIEIVNIRGDFYAERKGTPLFIGKEEEPVWIEKLGNKEIKLINEFIYNSKRKELKRNDTTLYGEFLIKSKTDTLMIVMIALLYGDWMYEDYDYLEKMLFNKNFNNLIKKRKKLKKHIVKNLKGDWLVSGELANLKRGDKIQLKRINENSGSCVWVFDEKMNFKSECLEIDLGYSTKYTLNKELNIIEIEYGRKKNEDYGYFEMKNQGMTLRISKLEKNIIEFTYMWR